MVATKSGRPPCPKCKSENVEPLGVGATEWRRGKRNAVWKCNDCGRKFSDDNVKQAETRKKIGD